MRKVIVYKWQLNEKGQHERVEGIQKAQAILQTFDKVSSDTFTRAITLAQDLADVYGGEASTQATLLGKALRLVAESKARRKEQAK